MNLKLHKIQEKMFDITLYTTYVLYFAILFGLSVNAPRYLYILDFFFKLYISLFLIWRFNPFRTVPFTSLDKKIIYNAAIFLLIITITNITTAYSISE
jgi:hypothetical protein